MSPQQVENGRRGSGRLAMTVAALVFSAWAMRAAAQIPDVPGWQLSWHDEFSGASVSTANWDLINLENSFNNEKQYYRPEQASIVDDHLRITATNQPLAGKLYRSARLESDLAFGPGRFEARIDLPTTQGMWPAFWVFPNSGVPWPQGGEIDILENRGSQPFLVSSAYHWQTNPGPCCDQHQYVFHEYTASEDGNPVNFHSGFHTYAVEWEETQLRFYVDGNLHFTVNENANRPIFETPKNIILNLAVGGDFGGDPNGSTVFPQYMDVDYVRVWQRPTGMSGDYNGDAMVDASDYTVWRDTLGKEGIGLPADGSGNGTVDQADYEMWLANFGGGSGRSAGTTAISPPLAVPEPPAVVLLLSLWLAAGMIGRRAGLLCYGR
jgi:beta-glucanase (GH16 family)